MNQDRIHEAIQLVRAGNKHAAEQILVPLVRADPHNINAWMWLVEARSALPDKVRDLEACARLNPGDATVQRALASFKARLPSSPAALSPEPAQGANRPVTSAPQPAPTPAPLAEPSLSEGPTQDPELTRFVIGQLSRHTGRSNLVQAVCTKGGMTWQEAEAFVDQVEANHRVQIAGRQAPLMLVIAGTFLIGGIGILVDFIQTVLAFPDINDGLALFVYLRTNYLLMLELPTGLAMVVGSIIGLTKIGKAFVAPPSEVQ